MRKTIEPIDVLVGEANDGHAELVEASLRESCIVNNLYRGRDYAETLAFVRHTWRECKSGTNAASLILLDCGLPRAGGVAALRALKSDRRFSGIPVIMMTTAYDRQQAELYRRLGCEAYVTKWPLFLGLPTFVRRIRFLADRASRNASRRLSAGRSNGYCAGTSYRRYIPDAAGMHHYGQACIRKEVKDESAAP